MRKYTLDQLKTWTQNQLSHLYRHGTIYWNLRIKHD